ncbi:uncharacterized protein LOC123307828 [Coccinella septempunctata]|uniref:uncharacterized protein LOC123307828 n=1 Tax=Coccinella septempunctata TaxID=41139 RepID=UPI001D0975F5|nr:uncharacterized protein LOC123307828 [Coccinella septempunctata]
MAPHKAVVWLVKTTILSTVLATQQLRLPVVKNKIESIDVICNADSFNVTVTLEHPFKGMLSAKDFSRECNSFGSLQKSVTLNLPTYGCGLRLSSKSGRNGELLMQYSVTLAIQQDRHLRQIADQEIHVSCQINSEEFSLNSQTMINELEADLKDDVIKRNGRMRQDEVWNQQVQKNKYKEDTKYHKSVKGAKAWMEIISEKENDSLENDKLRVGETAKLIVKSTLPVGIGWKVVDCIAHDGLGDSSQKLINDKGCPIDDQIMPKLKYGAIHDKTITKYQEAITLFPAFKFPDRDRLHMTCMLLLCKNSCSETNCALNQSNNHDYRSGKVVKETENILDQIKIFNSVEVLAPTINEYHRTKEYEDLINSPFEFEGTSREETLCISYHKVAISFCILGILFLIATVIATGGFLRARRSGNTLSIYTRSIFSSSSGTGSSHFGSKLLHDHSSFGFSTGGLQYGRI